MCRFVALAFLHVNLFGIGPHRLKDSFSSLVNHCFTSHYSSSWDVQIDRILHTLIIVCIIEIGLHHLRDEFSWLVDHFFTSHYSSFCDVQIDRILHTLIIVCIIVSLQSVGLSYFGMVACWRIIPRSLLPVAWCGFAKFCHY